MSAESGISTFRDSDGLWENYSVEEVCTHEAWLRQPEVCLNFYNMLRRKFKDCKPNEGHKLVAALQDKFDVQVITQNVDNLHERAGSSRVLHLHGELTKVRPEDCYTSSDGFSEKYVTDIGYRPVSLGETGGPRGRQLRPHIVWFGEAVPNLEKAAALVSVADILLIVGTSLQVYPAASLYNFASVQCRIFLIDPDSHLGSHIPGVTFINEVATAGMRKFRQLIISQ